MRSKTQIHNVLLLAIAFTSGGCAAVEHGSTYHKVKHQLLVADSGLGKKRLDIEGQYDRSVQAYIAAAGQPDYIFVKSQFKLQLIYVAENYVAEFERSIVSTASKVSKIAPVPESLTRKVEHAKKYPKQDAFSFSD